MKLIYYVIIRISLVLSVLLTGWAILFYFTVMDEVNDEVDDSLEDYSEIIIIRALAGEELPSKNTASNNQYFLREVTKEYAGSRDDDGEKFFELTVATPSIEKDDLKDAMAGWMIFLYIALLLTIIVINVWVFYRNMRPLYVLLHWLDKYRIGKGNEPLQNNTRVSEFRKLNEAAVRYAERSEQMFEQQKQFIGNASHEMQTPLAICRNRLEMLMEDENLSESQLEELMKTHQTLEHITKLNKSLLLLSKIENGQFMDTTQVEVNKLLRQYLEDYKEVYQYREIITSVEEEGIFYLTINETLAVVLLTNLLKNAFVHNIDGGHIRIVITPHSVMFCNTGAAQPLDAQRIFERFYQGKKKEGSTGLGLAIADTICKMQALRLCYEYKSGEHCFILYTSTHNQ